MNNILKVLIGIAAAIVAFAAVNLFIQKHRDQAMSAVVSTAADVKIAQLRENAAKNHPDAPEAVAIQKEAAVEAGNLVASAKSETQRRQNAVGVFFGFYLVNMRSRVEYCSEQGVSIQPFTDLFMRNNARELEVARPILENGGETEDKLYGAMKTQLRGMIDTDMKYIASSNKTDAKGACQIFVTRADALADRLQLSKLQPAVDQALMAPQ